MRWRPPLHLAVLGLDSRFQATKLPSHQPKRDFFDIYRAAHNGLHSTSIRGLRISTDIAASTSPPSIPIVPLSCRRRRQLSHQTLTIESTRRLERRLGPAHYTSDLPIQSKSTPYQFTTTQQCGSEHNPTTLKTQREKTPRFPFHHTMLLTPERCHGTWPGGLVHHVTMVSL